MHNYSCSINERLSGTEEKETLFCLCVAAAGDADPGFIQIDSSDGDAEKYPSERICSRRVNAPIIVAAAAAVGY